MIFSALKNTRVAYSRCCIRRIIDNEVVLPVKKILERQVKNKFCYTHEYSRGV